MQIVAIYKAYEFVLKVTETATNLFNPIPSVSYFRIKKLYLIQVGNLPPEVFYSPTFKEYPYTVRDIDFTKFEPEIIEATIGLNYKKRLKELFYSKPEAYAYVKSLKDIKYNELPVIAAQINKLYK